MPTTHPLIQQLARKEGFSIRDARPLAGGSIHQAVRLDTDRGSFFLKWNPMIPSDLFRKEADGLRVLRNSGAGFLVPEVHAFEPDFAGEQERRGDDGEPEKTGTDPASGYDISEPEPGKNGGASRSEGYILMEYIAPAVDRGRDQENRSYEEFGRALARLHSISRPHFGLSYDNYIGPLVQSNRSHSDWCEFFILERIEPQLRMALDRGKLPGSCRRWWDRLATTLPELFPDARPALLHGDLWSGNCHFDATGKAVLYDPAIYFGHPEMEIAFTRLFGGFTSRFYDAWSEVMNPEPGLEERVPLYNLYPLLVHVNLFGGHYCDQVITFLRTRS